jgi:MFS superfamily sulfate permease-like transporter
LGIALASNFPPIAGIFTAIIGGLLASLTGSASLTIKGPAAGLIVIVLGAVQELGQGDMVVGYKLTLAVGVVAAIIQIIIALTRKAVVAEIMPPAVIHGMLAAIGVIIISKQSYVLAGISPNVSEPVHLLLQLPGQMINLNPIVFGIGALAFAIVTLWPKIKALSFIPASIIILLCVISLSVYFNLSDDHTYTFLGNSYEMGTKFHINLPLNFFDAIQFPDFSKVFSPISLKYILMFALVGSIESLLTVCGVDSLVKDREPSDLNKDLRSVGIANLASALIGGLPMISEIVRSKANIDYGATSVKANFFHGLFMLLAVIFFPKIINLIPLSALAALLIFVGLRLASPQGFVNAYQVGHDQLFVFVTTFVLTITTDLLIGVTVGVLLELLIHRLRGHPFRSLFSPMITFDEKKDRTVVHIDGALTFVGYLKLKNIIEKLESKNIVVSLKGVTYIDHTVMKKIHAFGQDRRKITIEENPELISVTDDPFSPRQKR